MGYKVSWEGWSPSGRSDQDYSEWVARADTGAVTVRYPIYVPTKASSEERADAKTAVLQKLVGLLEGSS
jgi:hypothetical protein